MGYNQINIANDHNQDHIMRERINHIATVEDLSPEEELLLHHHEEEATSMEMNPGALPRPGRVPEQELLVPRGLLAMVVEIVIASGKRVTTKKCQGDVCHQIAR